MLTVINATQSSEIVNQTNAAHDLLTVNISLVGNYSTPKGNLQRIYTEQRYPIPSTYMPCRAMLCQFPGTTTLICHNWVQLTFHTSLYLISYLDWPMTS